jgi:ubiquinone/menaquinone biosynthesis C-methylase UbiE
MRLIDAIPKSESDILLESWGFNMLEEYHRMIKEANFSRDVILDVATGTGRAVSILTRMNYDVITADLDFSQRPEVEKRISPELLKRLKYQQFNLESIPYPDNSINNIVCINTLHEVENPYLCLKEIIRIHTLSGKMLIADFNTTGFDIMDKLHSVRYNRLHQRGKIALSELQSILLQNYKNVIMISTELNTGFIVSGK